MSIRWGLFRRPKMSLPPLNILVAPLGHPVAYHQFFLGVGTLICFSCLLSIDLKLTNPCGGKAIIQRKRSDFMLIILIAHRLSIGDNGRWCWEGERKVVYQK